MENRNDKLNKLIDMLDAQLGVRKRSLLHMIKQTGDCPLYRMHNIGALYAFVEDLKDGYIELSDRTIEYLLDADDALDEVDGAFLTATDDASVSIMNELEDIVKANTVE